MTVAVCLRCGAFKRGAYTTCLKCSYTPDDDESLTKHLLGTDHFHSREALEAIAARITSGESITFDEETLRSAWVSKTENDAELRMRRIGCAVLVVGLMAIETACLWFR